jgi:ubiquinol oxidase
VWAPELTHALVQVHFSESWNELHHLLIMESLGGNTRWADRFVAQHTAFAYFWVTCALYLASPRMAYNLMEQIEEHAFQTYDSFLIQHGEQLKKQPVPQVAAAYYNESDAYLFDEFQTGATPVSDAPGGASETDTVVF